MRRRQTTAPASIWRVDTLRTARELRSWQRSRLLVYPGKLISTPSIRPIRRRPAQKVRAARQRPIMSWFSEGC